MEKAVEYQALCADVAAYYSIPRTYHYGEEDIVLEWNTDCHEINLWTYWQGRGNLNPQILLVGQDWGAPSEDPSIMDTIRQMNQGVHRLYMDHHTTSPTDINLVKLFAQLGYSIDQDDPHNQDLFFTNLILGYRDHGISGGYQAKWLTAADQDFFCRLVAILLPKVILCLGQSTFEGVLKSLKIDYQRCETFNEQIGAGGIRASFGGSTLAVFPLAHCGALGTLNRNRGCEDLQIMHDPLYLQKQDWGHIKDFL